MTKLVVAAVQLKNRPGNNEEAYAAAEHYIEQAGQEGARLVVLPELSCCGYIPNQGIWQYAEKKDGPSVRWASDLAKKLGIYIGAGFTEYDGSDYYNSYLIANPQGGIDGIVRKANPESYCFRSSRGGNVIPTALGRIGVGICADTHSFRFLQRMQEAGPDIMLMPHGWPMPCRAGGAVHEKDIAAAREHASELSRIYAEQLSAPAIFVNAVGDFSAMPGILGRLMTPDVFHLGGYSQIVDGGGVVRGYLAQDEGYVAAEVRLPTDRIERPAPKRYGDWLHPGSAIMRKLILPVDAALGRRSYRRNKAKSR